MAAEPLDPLVDQLLARLPGLDAGLARAEALLAVRDFCQRTSAWREDLEETVQEGASVVHLLPPTAGSEIVHVYRVEPPGSVAGLWTFAAPATLWLPDPMRAGTIKVHAALQPRLDAAAAVPVELAQQWHEALYEGAAARLYAIPAKPWSSEKHATMHYRKFMERMVWARGLAKKGHRPGLPTWRYPSWTGG